MYKIWEREINNPDLQSLPSDFYRKAAEYLRRLREEGRMLDKKTVKASLLNREFSNVKRMVNEIILARYRKVVKILERSGKIPLDALTAEEVKIYGGAASFADSVHSFAKSILLGFLPKADVQAKNKRIVLRFFVDVPALIGSDMKAYGPFKAEDVASLPVENAAILVKRGLAEKVELG